MAQQFAEEIVHGFAANGMVVIQHQDAARGQTLKLIAERDHEWRLSCGVWRSEQREGLGARFGEDRADRGNEVTQEEQQVAVGFVQR